jgi:RNA polymerase sigma factor (sigma-70 family)
MPRDADDPSDDDDSLPDREETPSDDDDSSPDSDDEPVDEPDVPVQGDDPDAPPLDPAIVRRFLNSKEALDIARSPIRKIVPKGQVDDLAADAIVRALRARPPHLEIVLPAWLMTIAERTAIRWLEKSKRRKKYEGRMPTHVAREDDYTGEAVETDDPTDRAYDPDEDQEPEELLGDILDRFIGDNARDRQIRDVIHEHSEKKKSYAQIAASLGLTEDQLAGRIKRFKAKYTTRVRRRRQLVFFLKAFGVAVFAGVAIALAWYLLHRVRDDIRPDPSPSVPSLTPSASASAPVFLQALPPPPEPTIPGPDKPQPRPKP